MWSRSSLRKLSSTSLFSSNGGFKCISYMPSRYASAFSGKRRGESEKPILDSSPNVGMNRGFLGAKETVSTPYASNFQRIFPSPGRRDVEMERNSRPMDFVRGTLEHDNFQFSPISAEPNPDVVLINLKRNNTFINVLDSKGNTKFKATSGIKAVGGGGKVTRYASEAAAEFVGRRVKAMGLKSVVMRVKGFTFFKKKRQAIMSFRDGFSNSRSDQNPIVCIEDVTQRPHNGCRLPKKRRI